jgi:hypothetical protein
MDARFQKWPALQASGRGERKSKKRTDADARSALVRIVGNRGPTRADGGVGTGACAQPALAPCGNAPMMNSRIERVQQVGAGGGIGGVQCPLSGREVLETVRIRA